MSGIDLQGGVVRQIYPRQDIIIRRGGTVDGVWGPPGIYCRTCGMSPVNRPKLAAAIGVSDYALGKFMKRETVRDDVAAKIRNSVFAVKE